MNTKVDQSLSKFECCDAPTNTQPEEDQKKALVNPKRSRTYEKGDFVGLSESALLTVGGCLK
jgi:hypothetical protein